MYTLSSEARRGPSQETHCPWKKSLCTKEEAGVLISFQELIVCVLEAPDIFQPHSGAVDYERTCSCPSRFPPAPQSLPLGFPLNVITH